MIYTSCSCADNPSETIFRIQEAVAGCELMRRDRQVSFGLTDQYIAGRIGISLLVPKIADPKRPTIKCDSLLD